MCPLCVTTGTIALVSAGSAGGLSALAAKVLQVMRKPGSAGGTELAPPRSELAPEERRIARVADIGGDPFNAISGGL